MEDATIIGKTLYAGGSTSVNIRNNATTNSDIIGNVSAGSALGVATGNLFWDVDTKNHRWYEIVFSGDKGYVREDLVKLTKKSSGTSTGSKSTSGSGSANPVETLKTVFDTETTGLPKWAIAAIIVSFILVGVAIWFLVKIKKGRK